MAARKLFSTVRGSSVPVETVPHKEVKLESVNVAKKPVKVAGQEVVDKKPVPAKPKNTRSSSPDQVVLTDQRKRAAESAKQVAAARSEILRRMQLKAVVKHSDNYASVSSGSFLLDHLIGGTLAENGKPICLGYPRRKITEIFGPEASGKTTAALEAIAACQRQGGWCLYLDHEHALNPRYARKIGVNLEERLLHYEPTSMEESWKLLAMAMRQGCDLAVIDSVAAMVPKSELEKGLDEHATIGARARGLSDTLPKLAALLGSTKLSPTGMALILVNQTRSLIGGGSYGAPQMDTNTAGGKALKFYAYLRLSFNRTKSERIKRRDKVTGKDVYYPYGNHTRVRVVKSKLDAMEGRVAGVFIRFNHGYDDHYSLIEAAVVNRLVKKAGSSYVYADHTFRGREQLREYLIQNSASFEKLKTLVLAAIRDDGDNMLVPEPEDTVVSEEDTLLSSLGMDADVDDVSDAEVEVEEVADAVDEDDLLASVEET